MAACDKLDVVVMGHSYIRRLRDFSNSTEENRNLRLYRRKFRIMFRCQGGLTVPQLANSSVLLNFKDNVDICFLQIGGNDLSDNSIPVSDVARHITSFASFLIIQRVSKWLRLVRFFDENHGQQEKTTTTELSPSTLH